MLIWVEGEPHRIVPAFDRSVIVPGGITRWTIGTSD